jgi:hypothetical protein
MPITTCHGLQLQFCLRFHFVPRVTETSSLETTLSKISWVEITMARSEAGDDCEECGKSNLFYFKSQI